MEIFLLPGTYVALGTLIILEVVLGIDNLIFIAILAEKLPPHQRNTARIVGLGFALLMRLFLLSVISWVVSLTNVVGVLFDHAFSWRDIILLVGGLFLLFKGTRELHERLESDPHTGNGNKNYAKFWMVVTQIVVLDAVFSLDAVITAVGIAEHLPVMMLAVVFAMAIMLLAAKPLTNFVNAHPTVVVLCLSFLLLIGLSLIAESFGAHIPKGYLYAAIGFSVIIEFFNQVASHNMRKHEKRKPMRLRTAEAVLRLLGSDEPTPATPAAQEPEEEQGVAETTHSSMFASEEVNMVSRVLTLSDRTAKSIMTHRSATDYIDLESPIEAIRQQLLDGMPSVVPVCSGSFDNLVGVAYDADLLGDIIRYNAIKPETLKEVTIVPESMRVIKLLDTLRKSQVHLIFVADEYGSIEGLITYMDVFEAIVGEVPEEGEEQPFVALGEGQWRIAGTADVHHLELMLGIEGIVSEGNDYTSLGGFIIAQLGRLPEEGDQVSYGTYEFTVLEVAERRIVSVLVKRLQSEDE